MSEREKKCSRVFMKIVCGSSISYLFKVYFCLAAHNFCAIYLALSISYIGVYTSIATSFELWPYHDKNWSFSRFRFVWQLTTLSEFCLAIVIFFIGVCGHVIALTVGRGLITTRIGHFQDFVVSGSSHLLANFVWQ